MDIIDDHLEAATSTSSSNYSTSGESGSSDLSAEWQGQRGNLPRSTPLQALRSEKTGSCDGESLRKQVSVDSFFRAANEGEIVIRPPWTPPTTPRPEFASIFSGEECAAADEQNTIDADFEFAACNDRRFVASPPIPSGPLSSKADEYVVHSH